jgi:hypothetical protein
MKDKFKIGFFCTDSHASMLLDLFQEALPNHPRVDSVDWEGTFTRFGKKVLPEVGVQFLINNITKYDLIFIELESIPPKLKLFDDLKLWDKTIIYDTKDDQKIVDPATYKLSTEYVDKCLMYIKRSWDEHWLPTNRKNIIPLDFGVLNSYLNVVPHNHYNRRDLPITNTFLQGKRANCPRDIITHAIKKYDWPVINDEVMQVTLFYSIGYQIGSGHVGYRTELNPAPPNINWWYTYMHILSRTKILFTGASHSATGDTRTWESFSRGPLVFIDHIPIPQPNPMIAGKHYIKIDVLDMEGMIQQAKELLKDEPERARIAKAGYEHAITYHSSKARVNYVMDELIKRLQEKNV